MGKYVVIRIVAFQANHKVQQRFVDLVGYRVVVDKIRLPKHQDGYFWNCSRRREICSRRCNMFSGTIKPNIGSSSTSPNPSPEPTLPTILLVLVCVVMCNRHE